MSPNLETLGARLSGLHATSFLGIGVYLPFFPVWLQAKALSPTMIGVVIAIPIIVRILVTAPLLALADRSLGPRRLLMASHLGQIVGYPFLVLMDNELAIAALVALLSVAHASVVPANDLVLMSAVRKHPQLNYGWMRGWGSITFLVASIAAGYLIDAFGVAVGPWSLALLPVLALIAVQIALPVEPATPPRITDAGAPSKARFPTALWLVLAAFACTQASHAGVYTFGSIHWRSLGFSDSMIGYLWAIGVVVEIPVFLVLGTVVGRGTGAYGLLLLGSGAVMVRFTVLATDPGLATTFVTQALHGLTFAAAHLGTMAALAAQAPEGARGRAQGILGSVSALATATATIASGEIYRAAGPMVFAAMAPLGLAAMVLTLIALRVAKPQPQRAGEGG
jgi:PPP family 3-phenylpropionic acid transporter